MNKKFYYILCIVVVLILVNIASVNKLFTELQIGRIPTEEK